MSNKGNYVKESMSMEKEHLGIFYLAERIDEIAQSLENESEAGMTSLFHAKALRAEIESYSEKAVEKERKLWERYTRDLKLWALKHSGKFNTMEAGMTEPNPPHYKIANND